MSGSVVRLPFLALLLGFPVFFLVSVAGCFQASSPFVGTFSDVFDAPVVLLLVLVQSPRFGFNCWFRVWFFPSYALVPFVKVLHLF